MLKFARASRASLNLLQKRSASHGTAFEPPTGKLFNEPHLAKGEKRVKDGWEDIWVYGFGGCCVLMVIVAVFKPDDSITTWALREAKMRQEAAGTTPTYTKTT